MGTMGQRSLRSVGCHVFAGGFTMGVREVFEVPLQLEVHGLGQDTVESMGIDFVMPSEAPEPNIQNPGVAWPDPPSDTVFLFGNPRCTGFSCMTAGYDEGAHGAWAKPTIDIHQLMSYGVQHNIPVICWESVQQAWTVGKPMLNYLCERYCKPNGYRVAHLFINAATFGNAQHRKRYFFVAYKDDKFFNISAPEVHKPHRTVGEVLATVKAEQPIEENSRLPHADCCLPMSEDERRLAPHMPLGYCMNMMGRLHEDLLEKYAPSLHEQWLLRMSDMPFSMHCPARLHPDKFMPVIAGSSGRFIHPDASRRLIVREVAALMGWPLDIVPLGANKFGQIGKGIVPSVGTWLAEQVKLYHEGYWDQDYQVSYDADEGKWVGDYFDDAPLEKVFDLTRYCAEKPDV